MEKKLRYLFKNSINDIFIVRHPEVENHEDNVFNGTKDVGLSKKGYNQAKTLYEFFKNKNIESVISSPMKRCAVVAEQFRETAIVEFDERLKERNFGIFESLSWDKVMQIYPEEAENFLREPFLYRVKNGESFLDVQDRVLPFVKKIMDRHANILIIAHGGINRVIISNLLKMNQEAILRLSQDYACINHFQTDGDFILCKLINGKNSAEI